MDAADALLSLSGFLIIAVGSVSLVRCIRKKAKLAAKVSKKIMPAGVHKAHHHEDGLTSKNGQKKSKKMPPLPPAWWPTAVRSA